MNIDTVEAVEHDAVFAFDILRSAFVVVTWSSRRTTTE